MRAFVTGGTGFVGSHLVEGLLERGYTEVRCLVRGDLKWLANLPTTVVQGSLDNQDAIEMAMRDIDVVYHVAGLTRAPSLDRLVEVNVEGTMAVLEAAAAASVSRVLVTSSLAAVGPSGGEPHTEASALAPISDYGTSKAMMEQAIEAWVAEHPHGPAVTVVRPPAVYGPREADIYTIIRAADRQRMFPIVGDAGVPRLDLVFVKDLVRGMVAAAEEESASGKTYFVGGKGHTWREIRNAVESALGKRLFTLPVPGALVELVGSIAESLGGLAGRYPPLNREKAREAKATWLASGEQAERDLGYVPHVPLAEGMKQTVSWYRTHGWL